VIDGFIGRPIKSAGRINFRMEIVKKGYWPVRRLVRAGWAFHAGIRHGIRPKKLFVTLDADLLEADAHVLNMDREQMTERSLEAGIKRPHIQGR